MKQFRSFLFAITLGLAGIGITLAPVSVFAGRTETLQYLKYAIDYQAYSDYYAVLGLANSSQAYRYYEYVFSYNSYVYLRNAYWSAPLGTEMQYYAGVSSTYQYYAYVYAMYGYAYNTSYYEPSAAYYAYLAETYAALANYKAALNN